MLAKVGKWDVQHNDAMVYDVYLLAVMLLFLLYLCMYMHVYVYYLHHSLSYVFHIFHIALCGSHKIPCTAQDSYKVNIV